MEPISIICIAFSIIPLVFGVIVPIINLHKCTCRVNGTVSKIKDIGPDYGNPIYQGTVTYFYYGKKYRKKMSLGIRKEAVVCLLIDPKDPRRCIYQDKKIGYAKIIASICLIIFFIFLAVMGSSGR